VYRHQTPAGEIRAGVSHFQARPLLRAGPFLFLGGGMVAQDISDDDFIIRKPRSPREAATRFALIYFFGRCQRIPAPAEFAEWTGLPERIAMAELRRWHPRFAAAIEQNRG
jgi:hypothetical protein